LLAKQEGITLGSDHWLVIRFRVLGFLLGLAVKHQRAFPSLNTIAAAMLCSKSTVLRAIAWLRLHGFLDRIRRIIRTPGALGPRVRQTSNAYCLRFPKGFGRGPECHKTTPSRSESEVKQAMRGSEFEFAAPPGPKLQPAVQPDKKRA
jgi:Helix-turn-helix domain